MTEVLEKETFSFQTEVGQILQIVAGSLYSNREVFLREIVSNASGACHRLRDAALTDSSRGLIGQFGLSFHSAFMVASQVDVLTRKAGEDEAWVGSSDGKEFADTARIRQMIKTCSEHISFPGILTVETLNPAQALWTKAPKDITEDQYAQFYKQTHMSSEGPCVPISTCLTGASCLHNLSGQHRSSISPCSGSILMARLRNRWKTATALICASVKAFWRSATPLGSTGR
ncbi:Hsp90 protein [Roseobacter denitrificans OCh 114]|nr:Hsp90 protein [Roseobacter denitrificans OCh 114]